MQLIEGMRGLTMYNLALIVFSIAGLWIIVSNLVSVCSMLHLILPPYETFSDYPTFQKYYKLVVLIVGNIALNKRESVVSLYPSVKNGK